MTLELAASTQPAAVNSSSNGSSQQQQWQQQQQQDPVAPGQQQWQPSGTASSTATTSGGGASWLSSSLLPSHFATGDTPPAPAAVHALDAQQLQLLAQGSSVGSSSVRSPARQPSSAAQVCGSGITPCLLRHTCSQLQLALIHCWVAHGSRSSCAHMCATKLPLPPCRRHCQTYKWPGAQCELGRLRQLYAREACVCAHARGHDIQALLSLSSSYCHIVRRVATAEQLSLAASGDISASL